MDTVDCVVIGAGVVGLAVARQLALAGLEPLIIERHRAIGMETSSRNSEVIHAGLYYAPGSLKARLCLRGRDLLYTWCQQRGIAHRRCGKLIVATHEAQRGELEVLERRAIDNGVNDLRLLERAEAQALEPALHCVAALLSPSTGIIDSHAYLLSLLGDAEAHGAILATSSAVTAMRLVRNGIQICINDDPEPLLLARRAVNAAGLHAPALARAIEGFPTLQVPAEHFAKGSYFTLDGRPPFSRLVYPLPQPGGLGVHLTLDLAGQARFGPDVEWLEPGQPFDYAVDPARAAAFHQAILDYWPGLRPGQLLPGYAGIRPKLAGPGAPAADFRLDGPQSHGVPGLVNLFGIESPGLTASLAIAERVGALLAAA
ncbi:NAD(P)/FAD-dependent oxidoreductase [Nevskia soli]|uniref:NAD(P)/FAD-dependent oxidoreductase n=1 Tax=Nevskia soli TaxID=418856 RepID=UPI0004A6D686|nr:NAD(P)/FAD-dependent oxidoreductase [Nevskia soli]